MESSYTLVSSKPELTTDFTFTAFSFPLAGDTSSEFFRLRYQPDNNKAPATVLVNLKTSLPVGVEVHDDKFFLYADNPSYDSKNEVRAFLPKF